MKRTMWLGLLAGVLLCGTAWADDEDDAPGRGVARISLINGDVSVRRGDSGEWVAAAINAPLVTQDHVLTGTGSHAEVQFDWATFVRLGADTELRLADLENKRYQVQLSRGTVMLSVLREGNADVEVDTPNVSVRPVKRGDYRITVNADGQSEVTVRSGEVEAYTPRGVERVASGRTMLVRGTADNPEYQFVRALEPDEFDRWNEDRDRRLEHTRSYQYVSRDIYGAEDLDSYGRWINAPPYGWVWCPNGVAADWAPYRYGRWSWVDYYGWSWVSYDPWGWAPYHYGRWFWGAPYGWCWFPGPVYSHHFWRPALVAFFGFGGGGGFGFGFGNVGWVPLAPYERFHPWYGRGWYGRPGYINNVRITNVNINNVYRNARVHNGITGVDTGGFVGGRGGRAIRVNDFGRNAGVIRGAIPITPSAASQRLGDRAVSPAVARMTAAREPRFFERRPPTQIQRVPFETQRQHMEQIARRTFPEAAAGRQPAAGGAVPAVGHAGAQPAALPGREAVRGQAETRTSPAGPASGWRRVGEANRTPENRPSAAREGATGSWRRPADAARSTPPAAQPRVERQAEPTRQAPARNEGGNWRQSGGAPNRESAPAPARQAPAAREQAAPRTEQRTAPSAPRDSRQQFTPRSEATPQWRSFPSAPEAARSEAPRWSTSRSAEPVRLNAPIVRERSAPSYERSAPSYQRSAPSYSAPHYESSAPAARGGGERASGGGGGRSSGGGHSSDGGGGRGSRR